MAEPVKSYKRVIFPNGEQLRFLNHLKRELRITWTEMARVANISKRTLGDWKREKFNASFEILTVLSKKANHPLPKNSIIKEPFWYVKKGASKGGQAVYRKYGRIGGDPETRKKKWQEWWETKGKFIPNPILHAPLSIQKPQKSEELAEFVGIVMGDGSLTKYQLSITLHHIDDKEYSKFVIKLIKKLFNVQPSIYHIQKYSVNNIKVSRTQLVIFCTEELEMKVGNKVKQQIDIPLWIKGNKKFQIACLRGLVDTDGCVFTHTYKVNGKSYSYKKLCFSSRSYPLLISVHIILKDMGFNPRLTPGIDVRLDSKKDIEMYFSLISSHNPKHLRRYHK